MELTTMFTFLLVLQFTLCPAKDTIFMNQSLKEGELLISKENNFALGFFSPGNSRNRYLGIWFNKIPVQTVAWVANRKHPINGFSGFLFFNQHGNLVIFEKNNPVWSTNVSAEVDDTMAARLSDSGNLVLVQGWSERILWQSYDHPTNTLLPGMKLGLNRKTGRNRFLTSWKSSDDPGIGDHSFKLNQSGSPQIFLNHGKRVRWRTGPWPWKTYSQGIKYSFEDNGNEIYHSYLLEDDSLFGRLVLEDSGLLKWLVWHESEKKWNEFWSAPKDGCDLYRKCGANGKCTSNILNIFECDCLPGHEPKYPRNWQMRDGSGGCIRKRLESSSICGHGEGFIKVESVQIPDTSSAVWVDMSIRHMDCEEECRRNCSCTAYASIPIPGNETGCLAWFKELIDTRNYVGGTGRDVYVRVDAIELAESAKRSNNILPMKGLLILSIISAWFLIIMFIILWILVRKNNRLGMIKRRWNKRLSNPTSGSNFHGDKLTAASELEGGSIRHSDLVFFNFNTILAATGNFSSANRIGQGGFGTVYRGQLCNGQEIAVKRMSVSSMQGIQEFKTEIVLISKLQHRNLVRLLGCCIKRKEQILVYEYLPNKSLDSFLVDETKRSLMDWRKRFHIIVGIARGLLYLHQDSRLTIIHRDLKSSNILLDAELNPKISDFGMATIVHSDQIQGKTNKVVGTYGYMSPEYAVLGKFSVKSDVFSFGVILLEVISGKKSNGLNQEDPSLSLIGQVWELWNEGRVFDIVDSSLIESYSSDEALRCIQIGLLCVQEDAMDRPPMLEVILMLKSETTLPPPKQPAYIFRTSSFNAQSPETYSINEITMSDVLTR